MGTVLTVSKMDTEWLLEEPVPVVQDSTACGVPTWGWKVGPLHLKKGLMSEVKELR